MKHTTRIIGGVALLAVGVVGAMEIYGLIDINFAGWWALFVIIPCFASLFTSRHKQGALFGLGVGVLLLLAAQGIIQWHAFGAYVLCWLAVTFGLALIFGDKNCCCKHCGQPVEEELKFVDVEGRKIHKSDVCFGKQEFDFDGQTFEGAEVKTSFGYTGLDLRKAEVRDKAVINVDCSFGGMEIRVGRDVCVRTSVETAFAGVENKCSALPGDGVKTLYVEGKCSFGGIEIK